jgi:hypothetical protein
MRNINTDSPFRRCSTSEHACSLPAHLERAALRNGHFCGQPCIGTHINDFHFSAQACIPKPIKASPGARVAVCGSGRGRANKNPTGTRRIQLDMPDSNRYARTRKENRAMKKNTALVAYVLLTGLTLSFLATQVTVGWKVVIAFLFGFVALLCASMTKED